MTMQANAHRRISSRIASVLCALPLFGVTVPVFAAAPSGSATFGSSVANSGGFGVPPAPLAINPATTYPACSGNFTDNVAKVSFEPVDLGGGKYRLKWSYLLTAESRAYLGSPVTVSMVIAYVNENDINPPYSSHTEVSTYDFHSSMSTYQYIGKSGGGVLHKGNVVEFGWEMLSVEDPNHQAWRDTACTME